MPSRTLSDRLRETGGCCIYCGHPLNADSATVDHIIPLSKGGANEDFNKVISCRACNRSKGDLYPSAFMGTRPLKRRKGFERRLDYLVQKSLMTPQKRDLLLDRAEGPLHSLTVTLKLLRYRIRLYILVRKTASKNR